VDSFGLGLASGRAPSRLPRGWWPGREPGGGESCRGAGGPFDPEGQVELAFGEGSFLGAGFWESNVFGLLLILADNYNNY
jgi:hypothetical protein